MSFKRHSLSLLVLSLLLATSFHSLVAQVRTVLVSPVPGNPIASGTALRNALAGIPSPSSTNPWLVKIEPGIYDIGTVSLPMRSWVDIEGSGIGVTTIRGTVNGFYTNGTIVGASNAELRMLTVVATASPTATHAIAMYNDSAVALRLYRVKFVTSTPGGGVVWGIRNATSAPLIEECEISVSAPTSTEVAYGIVYVGFVSSGQRSAILRSRIAVNGAAQNYGVFMIEGQTLTEIRDSRIDVGGGQHTYGLYATGPFWLGSESINIRNTDLSSAGGSVSSTGVFFSGGTTVTLDVSHSKIWGHVAPATYGIRQGGSSPMGFQSASIVGFTKTIESSRSVSVLSTFLNGGPITAAGWLGCMGVWDENGVFYANSCPP